jgi:Family of unknown function (DUF6807)
MNRSTKRRLMVMMVCSCGLLSVVGVQSRAAGEHRVTFVERSGVVILEVDGRSLATYVYRDPQILRPYFKELYAPGGPQVTRRHPPKEGSDPTDHKDMHPGLWLAFGDISGADFWRNKARVEHVTFVKQPLSKENGVGFTVRNRYRDGDKIVCDEICEYRFLVRPAGYLILWNSVFQSDASAFYFGDQEEMGLGVRMATSIMVKSGEGGRILDDKGRKNEKGIWGKEAQWCDYSGWLDDVFTGITIMPNPSNARPCRWHTRDYGFMAANPFGREVFDAGSLSKLRVEAGQPFRLGFGVLVHTGKGQDSVDLDAAYQDYVELSRSMPDSGSIDK